LNCWFRIIFGSNSKNTAEAVFFSRRLRGKQDEIYG